MPASTEFVRAGNWVFGTGLRGAASAELFRQMEARLQAAGSSLSRVARLDQYYPDFSCVPPYQAARKQAFEGRQVAPSTSVVISRLQDETSQVDVQVMAASAGSGYQLSEVQTGLNRPETSGYAPALRVGDLVFVAGQLARDGSGKLAVHGVQAETRYIIEERLRPALLAAGSGLDLILKAQVYVSQPGEIPAFAPSTVVRVRHPAFLTREATVEINVIAAHRSAASRVRDLKGKARSLDGLLFVGGLNSLEDAQQIFDLAQVVRGVFFHARGAAPADPGFPYSAVEVESGPVIDLWGYVP